MGVRPNLYTIFGVDDYDGPMPDDGFWETQIHVPDDELDGDMLFVKDFCHDYQKKEWRWYPDVLYFGLHSSAVKGIAGLVVSHDFDSDTFRALALLYPEFMQSGYRDVPLEDPELRKLCLRGRQVYPCGGIEFREQWFYPHDYHSMTAVWAYVTQWLFRSMGAEIDPDRYKWMLVWEWC